MGDEAIFVVVVGARFLVPLLIPRFPLPAILAALVIDAADQSIFQQFTDLDLTGYQGYDKALDVYYLTIAYLSTMRNWFDPLAFRTAQFLWYYRLIGVMAFEVFDERWLLLVFANTFEYFFIFYEGVRTSWDPRRLGRNGVLGAAAGIWIFIKLPQEWWIHVAQLDFTDFMKEDVFGVDPTASWGEAFTNRPAVTLALVVGLVVVALVLRRLARRLPPVDWPFTVDADVVRRNLGQAEPPPVAGRSEPVWSAASFEKVALITLVTAIFAKMLPGVEASGLQITLGVAGLVLVNAAVSLWRTDRGLSWGTVGARFAALTVLNIGLIGLYTWLLRRGSGTIDLSDAVFFSLLITLIVVLFDRYQRVRSARLEGALPPAT